MGNAGKTWTHELQCSECEGRRVEGDRKCRWCGAFGPPVRASSGYHPPLGSYGARGRHDQKRDGAKPRPCARCGKRFTPTMRRWMLCSGCFKHADDDVTLHSLTPH